MSKRKSEATEQSTSTTDTASDEKKAKTNNPNSDICKILLELGDYEKNVTRQIHKYNAYRKAAAALAQLPTRIQSGEEAMQLPGIGKKIGLKIGEILTTGKLQKVEKIRTDDTSVAIQELTRVSGIGPANARKLVEEGVGSIEELRKNTNKLNHHQKLGLKYLEDFEQRIPRCEMKQLEEVVLERINGLDAKFVARICGSYRRGALTCGDIDVLITHPSFTSVEKYDTFLLQQHLLAKVVTTLEVDDFVTDCLSQGETKFMGVCRLDKNDGTKFRRIDVRLIPHDQYWCGVLYFTGSDEFNRHMRATALDNGFTLNEYCLRKVGTTNTPGEAVEIASEQDVFDYLGMEYKGPTERNV